MTRPLPTWIRLHLSSLRMLLLFTALTGLLYPLAVTGAAQALFGHEANGSRIERNGAVVGSSLLGQRFDLRGKSPHQPGERPRPDPRWFQPRPSAGGYDPLASGASNLGPRSGRLLAAIDRRRTDIARFNHVDPATVPADALTAGGSGLDPHISRAYARLQTARVARARGLSKTAVDALVNAHLQSRILGFLGEERVNVVELNAALSRMR
ncbi:potassium-transporting ATPase subunit KdpC [Streptomyces palmae]|uniref:Potassium-transporting ATPase KdpC subunit n=1 Tax=Streptomyces palmae TaxID=1701085 RepID=A0A4Z0H9W6_9ACTN|nr:potassium-transporting ATPase subunit KdpC [Streptomyces palmae]TGB07275.1 potassium-transporting ATPase subunit KdpC [Streptomyces palmae]